MNQEKEKSAPAGAKAWNPFSELMQIFKKHGVEVTSRDPRQIAVVAARGTKLGAALFGAIAEAYCTDAFIVQQGRSISGFLNCMDRLADKIKRTDPTFKPRRAFGLDGKEIK